MSNQYLLYLGTELVLSSPEDFPWSLLAALAEPSVGPVRCSNLGSAGGLLLSARPLPPPTSSTLYIAAQSLEQHKAESTFVIAITQTITYKKLDQVGQNRPAHSLYRKKQTSFLIPPKMSPAYQAIHLPHDIPDLSKPFDITSPAKTDVWEKPPSTHSFNAPIVYQTTTVGQFKRAQVTVSAAWKDKYDQGGLALIVNPDSDRQWVKSGIEFENDQPNLSTVATPKWSDWSLLPLSRNKATLETATADDGSLWVYLIEEDGKKVALREVTWWADLSKDAQLWVGPYVAKVSTSSTACDLPDPFAASFTRRDGRSGCAL